MVRHEFRLELEGKILVLARMGWVFIAMLTLGLFALAIPARFDELGTVCPGAACRAAQLSIQDIRVLQGLGLSRATHAMYNLGLEIFFASVYFAIAVIIFVRRSHDRVALLVSLMLMTFGPATFTGTMNALVQRSSAWQLPVDLVSPISGTVPDWLIQPYRFWELPVGLVYAVGQVSFAIFFLIFPDGRFVPRWGSIPLAVWIIWQIPAAFFANSSFNAANWPQIASIIVWLSFLACFILIQVYRFRRVSNPVQKQQTKWVVFGVTTAIAGYFVSYFLALGFNNVGMSDVISRQIVQTSVYLAMLLMPISFGVAISRSRLWDIDILINRTLVYSILTGLLLIFYLGVIFLLQFVFTGLTGREQSEIVIAVSTIAIAAMFNPLRHRIQNGIDRRFYRRKYDAAQVLTAFGNMIRDEADLDRLTNQLLIVVQETMEPTSISLWINTQSNASKTRKSK
jgi:hypothetical protein